MSIKEWLNNNDKGFSEGAVPFKPLSYTNMMDDSGDVNEKTDYQDGQRFSFLERLEMAKEELKDTVKEMDMAAARKFFKESTEDGNMHYFGGMCFVNTSSIDTDDAIWYGVRMD